MTREKASLKLIEENKQGDGTEDERLARAYAEKVTAKINLKYMTQEQKMQDASKTLYLKRYE